MQRKMFLKTLAAPALAAMALCAVTAHAQTPVEVPFYYPVAVGGPITKVIDGYAADFNKAHPQYKVVPIYAGTYQETIVKALTAHKSGKAPATSVLLSTDMFTLIDEDAIAPSELLMAAADCLDTDPWRWVLAGGEDHTLLGTTPGEPPTGFRRIGTAHRDRGLPVSVGGRQPWLRGGWVSF